ncbi:MAG: GatB/YqeY domain-containing protein [Parcubacteria group bacterium GW2011_GWB1_41_6]|nr:MAG: GatB/YqeY domain-containing protein [Parcubacteria group bacterium GW2011_GWB1_41_6]KKS33729.1 MAG: GatB/YqeY domain-containing protein [Parcubacteria group bacterium GW2011_GWC2_42_13]
MNLKETINQDLKDALRNKEELKVSVFRMLLSALANKEIELMKKTQGLSEEEAGQVLKKEIKNRKKSIEAFQQGGREDLVQKEEKEKEILEKYLPPE